jgi:nitrile hydratase accessory protein
VFAEPWEGRAFGMAVTLHEAGMFSWDEFRAALVSHIAAGRDTRSGDHGSSYYHHWLAALEETLAGARIVSAREVSQRGSALSRRAAGHDH